MRQGLIPWRRRSSPKASRSFAPRSAFRIGSSPRPARRTRWKRGTSAATSSPAAKRGRHRRSQGHRRRDGQYRQPRSVANQEAALKNEAPQGESQRSESKPTNQKNEKRRMAPRVAFEPTTNRLTAGCSTTELPRNIHRSAKRSRRGLYQVRRQGERPATIRIRKTRDPFGALEGVGYGGVSPREDKVNIALTGKGSVNSQRIVSEACESVEM